MTNHDNTNEPSIVRESHPWAVLDGATPLFHVPGTYPPVYRPDEALEALWRVKHPRVGKIIQLTLWEYAA